MPNQIGIQYIWPEDLDEPEEHQIWFPRQATEGVRPTIPISSLEELTECIKRLGNSFIVFIDPEFPPAENVWPDLLIWTRVHDLEVIFELPGVGSDSSQEEQNDEDQQNDPHDEEEQNDAPSDDEEEQNDAPSDDEEEQNDALDEEEARNHASLKVLSDPACNRLHIELDMWQAEPPSGFNLLSSGHNQRWLIEVIGAPGTLFADETYQLQIDFPEHYPIEAPQVRFVPPLPLHPLIYSDGHIGLVAERPWSPTMTVSSICISILSMLSHSTVKEGPEENDNEHHLKNCDRPAEKIEVAAPR